ncbi:4-hydroxybenzoate octaprenyltransferase [Sansalvadorimonas sp. 2012CJ34-2]|uniref:4-hydroxybenzoate octaprenyltransferase n=1 Tax=Parendozoicomonas callyspongiae TaxID=2942213 RepID=A0ABT0PEF1_9GAMM|nr:4-hydroxybenzoate octaprenyltransferase [Sansalvadorimonas sp. 2012CJ34-2]MCL6269750.1 4-hydroxybenzoate octaprenyltransferase [Sansalvadorimonas sp. 2012CJ34-2]
MKGILNPTLFNQDRLNNYVQLTRLNRPIGIYLLLWPTLWALWLAADGWPEPELFVIFVLGTVLMRSAGCVINDFADRNFDAHVKRTKDRPMATGKVSEKEALILFAILILASFLLVLMTNPLTIALSFAGASLAATYPFMKRFTHWPQAVLGAAFAWGIPMAWAAQTNTVDPVVWALFLAFLLWTIAYDTQYAMVDRDDDLTIGIKSTAILFGEKDNVIIGLLQALTLLALLAAGMMTGLGTAYYLGVLFMSGSFIYQHTLTKDRDRDGCFKAFLSNHWAGLAVLIGIILDRCIL